MPTICHGACFGEAALAGVHKGQAHPRRFVIILPGCLEGLFFCILLPGFMIEVAYLTSDAFLLSGIVGSKYCRKRRVVAE